MKRFMAVIAAVMVFSVGCANGHVAKARQVALAALKLNTAGVEAFKKFDYEFQKRVVDRALADGSPAAINYAEQLLRAYRAKRGEVLEAFNKLFAVITLGNTLIPLVESGINKESDLTTWQAQLMAAVKELQTLLTSLGVKVPFSLPF